MKINIEYSGDKYAIEITEESYNLIKYGVNSDGKSKNFGQKTERILGYFSNISNAIRNIIKSSLASKDEEVTLREYIDRLEKGIEELTKKVDL